ncbi:hypothetical protein CVT24_008271, partial [Panaeolus cyanescens]
MAGIEMELPTKLTATGASQWNDFVAANGVLDDDAFVMDEGPEEVDKRKRDELIQKLVDHDIWGDFSEDGEYMDENEYIQDGQDHDDILTELLQNIARQREESGVQNHQPSEIDSTWHPYPSKLMFLLDAIDNLPRLRISSSVFKVFLWVLENLNVKNVPSMDAFRKMQQRIRKEAGIQTTSWTSPKKNHFSFNDPAGIIANDWTNPLVRPHIRRYPVIPKNGL